MDVPTNYMAQSRSLEERRAQAEIRTLLKLKLYRKHNKNKHYVGFGSVPSINLRQVERVVMQNYGKGTGVLGAFHGGKKEALRLVLGAVTPEKEPQESIGCT